MLKLLRDNYGTYINTSQRRSERHWSRLLVFMLLSAMFAFFSTGALAGVFAMMATGVTVLTGFTFTALFSDHALASSALPQPKNENDRHDLLRLDELARNFRARSAYFISLSILTIVLLAAVSVDLALPSVFERNAFLQKWLAAPEVDGFFDSADKLLPLAWSLFAMGVIFLYLECLYTFYRMAQTILAILNTRRTYLSADDGEY